MVLTLHALLRAALTIRSIVSCTCIKQPKVKAWEATVEVTAPSPGPHQSST